MATARYGLYLLPRFPPITCKRAMSAKLFAKDAHESGATSSERKQPIRVDVDIIIPVHNSAMTIVKTVESAMFQTIPERFSKFFEAITVDIGVCCYDDGSSDGSWSLLCRLRDKFASKGSSKASEQEVTFPSKIFIAKSKDGVARGAGYARNKAASLRTTSTSERSFLCLLDSDDTMHPTRVAEQLHAILCMDQEQQTKVILGCTFDRDPPESTRHYANWANSLTTARLSLERFREVTVLQPTWFMDKSRFVSLGGYIEAPHPSRKNPTISELTTKSGGGVLKLVHPMETVETLRLAEDLRLFHAHLAAGGVLQLCRTEVPLVTYRHRSGMSQSSQTSRKLLFRLRVLAFEATVLSVDPLWQSSFIVWGAGRDGKDFVKMLSSDARKRVACMVDVDEKKINAGYYANKECGVKIPIVHFSLIAADPNTRRQLKQEWEAGLDESELQSFGKIDKGHFSSGTGHATSIDTNGEVEPPRKQRRVAHTACNVDLDQLPRLPVVVCVTMYRTNGALEKNVSNIGRMEGKDLWHFC